MDKPIEFIQIDKETKKLKVSQDAIKELQKVNKPLKVVAIVGNSRSGKSFLMNRLMKRNNGFPLGSTINSETKGIWMWISDHPGDQDKALLLLDTEGLNDPIKGDQNHDAKIFTLATLLSSIIVLNSLSVIGAEQIEKFHLASQLSKHIQTKRSKTFPSSIKENKRDLEFATFFPELIWTQRDFYLELKDGKGQPITEDEYLEQCLMVKPDENETDSTSRAIKQAIRDHFPKRHCFTLPPPVTFNQLNHLDTLTESKLDHDFLEAGKKFTDFVYQCHSFYNLKGEMLTGQSFAILADQYTTLINDGSIDLQSAHSNMITSVNSGAIQTILSKFKDFLETLVFPMSNDAFFNAHTSQREILFKEFQIKCINLGDHMEFKEEFDNKFIDLIREYRIKNLSCSEAKCQEKLNELFQPVAANLKRNDYHKPGGYHNLRKDVDVMEVQYKDFDKPEETGPKYSEVKEEFWGKKVEKMVLKQITFLLWLH